MILSMSGQARLFLLTIAIGFFIGFVYDVFRIIRKTFHHPDFLTQLEDVLYWLLVTFVMFYFMLNKNYGEIRAFSIIGAFLGMGIYFLTLSFLVMKVSLTVIDFLKKVLSAMLTIILFPLKVIWKLLSFPLGFLRFVGRNFFLQTKKRLKKSHTYVRIKGHRLFRDLKIIIKKI